MAITGPVTPSYYLLPYLPSPNATMQNISNASANEGTILTCTKTGRMWIVGRTNDAPGAPTYIPRQILPCVRRDDGTAGVQSVNDNGTLRFEPTPGAADGDVVFTARLSMSGAAFAPGITHFPIYQNIYNGVGTVRCRLNTNELMAIFPSVVSLPSDVTIANANTAQNIATLGNTDAGQRWMSVDVNGVAYHNNNFELSVCIARYRVGTPATIEPLVATTVTAPQSGGYVSFSLKVDKVFLDIGEEASDQIRVYVASNVSGVVLKAAPAFAFPDTRNPPQTPATTYAVYEYLA